MVLCQRPGQKDDRICYKNYKKKNDEAKNLYSWRWANRFNSRLYFKQTKYKNRFGCSKLSKTKDRRTTALSRSNYDFLIKFLGNENAKLFWPSNKINLYHETSNENKNFMSFQDEGKNLICYRK